MFKGHWQVHCFYWIIILAACLVFETAVDWAKLPNVSELITFSVGIVSLVLAIIAIIQNIVSGPALASSIAAINSSAQNVTNATDKMNQSAHSVLERLETIDDIPRGLGDLQAAVTKLSATQAVGDQEDDEHAAERPAVSVPSPGGTVGAQAALYLLARAIGHSQPIELIKVFSGQSVVSEYIAGYLTALRDVNAITYKLSNQIYSDFKAVGSFNADAAIAQAVRSDAAYVKARVKEIDRYFEAGVQPPSVKPPAPKPTTIPPKAATPTVDNPPAPAPPAPPAPPKAK